MQSCTKTDASVANKQSKWDSNPQDRLLADISPTGDPGKCEEVQELPGDSDQAGIQWLPVCQHG